MKLTRRPCRSHCAQALTSLVLFLAMPAFAAKPLPTEAVEVTGVGDTRGAARQDAYRAAVEKVVGSFVTADLITENDAIIKDEVLGFSAGFIDSAEVLSEGKRDDGLYAIHLKATVVVQKVVRQLETLNISVSQVSSESLFAEATTKIDQRDSAQAIWSKFWDGGNWWTRAFELKALGKPAVVPFDQGEEVYAIFGVSAKLNEDFANELESTIRGASLEVAEGPIMDIKATWNSKLQGRRVICLARLSNSDKTNSAKPRELDINDFYVKENGSLLSRQLQDSWDLPFSFDLKGRGEGICGLTQFPHERFFGEVRGPRDANRVVKGPMVNFEARLKDQSGSVVAKQTGMLIKRQGIPQFQLVSTSFSTFGYEDNAVVFYRGDYNFRWIAVRMNKVDLDAVSEIELSTFPNEMPNDG